MLARGYLITPSADHSVVAFAIMAVTAVVLLTTRIHPLSVFVAAGLLGPATWV
jgi:hypothetical protein